MRRGTLIAIIVLFVLLAALAAFQIAAFSSRERPPAPAPSSTQ